jgi:hypothetical protein
MSLVLTAKERESFDGPIRIVTVKGPLTLFRLCGRTAAGAVNNPHGRFWFNEKFFWRTLDLLTDNVYSNVQLNHYLRYLIRESTAVCYDWNTFTSIYQLALPANETLNLAAGRIAPQPFYSSSVSKNRTSLPHEILVGGEFQYIVDLSANQDLKRYVQGPRPFLISRGGRA